MSDDTDEFQWRDNPDVVVPSQLAVAVYENVHGEVCIRQEGQYGPEEEVWINFPKDRALAVVTRILEVAGLDSEALTAPALRAIAGPKDPTGAERQRRYRDAHRNGGIERDVTPAAHLRLVA